MVRFKKTIIALALGSASPVFAQQAMQEQRASADVSGAGGEIIVTGTSIRGIAPPAIPVLSFDREDIERSGAPSVAEFVRTIPQNTNGGAAQESRASGAGAFGGSAITLRGFGPNRTLTLLDGHRLAPQGDGAFVDVSFLPVAAIEAIDIVPVGASSIYGADAVGGVVNFRLRDDYVGAESRLQFGTTTSGGGTVLNLGQAVGTSWSSGNALLAYDYFDQQRIRAGQRDFTGGENPANPGLSIEETDIIPDIARHSLFGAVRQSLGSRTTAALNGYYVSSDTRRRSNFSYLAELEGENVTLEERLDTKAIGGTLTLRQQLGDEWQAELSGTYSENDLQGGDTDLRTGLPTNIFSNEDYARFNQVKMVEARADGALFSLPGGPVKLAFGGQYRQERFDRRLDTLSPTSRNERDVSALFGEVFVPLVGVANARPGLQRLEFSASARYEHIGDVDERLSDGTRNALGGSADSFDPQFGVMWSPVRDLELRGSYGTSFAVASLESLRAETSLLVLEFLDLGQPTNGAINTLLASGVDNDLGPETSTFWTLGADWKPAFAPGLKLSVTYYNIDLENVIGQPASVFRANDPLIADFVTLNPTAAQSEAFTRQLGLTSADYLIFGDAAVAAYDTLGLGSIGVIYDLRLTNLAERRYRGFDIGIDYQANTGRGSWGASANVVLITDYRERASRAQPSADRLDTAFQPLNFRARAGAFWSQDGFGVNAYANYADSYRDVRFATPQSVDADLTIDASISYSIAKTGSALDGLRLQLSAQNLLDADPPRLTGISSINSLFTGDLGYDFVNASARGRYVQFSIVKSW